MEVVTWKRKHVPDNSHQIKTVREEDTGMLFICLKHACNKQMLFFCECDWQNSIGSGWIQCTILKKWQHYASRFPHSLSNNSKIILKQLYNNNTHIHTRTHAHTHTHTQTQKHPTKNIQKDSTQNAFKLLVTFVSYKMWRPSCKKSYFSKNDKENQMTWD